MPVSAQITGLIYLEEIADRLDTFEKDVYEFFRNRIRTDWKDILISMNEQNLDEGIRPDGSLIEKTPIAPQQNTRYERYTIYLKNKRGDLVDSDSPVTLRDTGDFRAAIDIVVQSQTITFIDRNWKAEILEGVWGGNSGLLGITNEQLDEFVFDDMMPEFYKWVKRRFSF